MGSGLGWLNAGGFISDLIGGGIGMAHDYPLAQQAAEETNASQRDAIDRQEQLAWRTGDAQNKLQWSVRDRQNASNQSTYDDSMGRLQNWTKEYWKNGGQMGNVQGQLREGGAMEGLWRADRAAQDALKGMDARRGEYAGARDMAKSAFEDSARRTDETAAELRANTDLAGMKGRRDKMYDDLMNVRGASEIVGAVSGDQQAKQDALADLEANRHSMTPDQYLARKQQITNDYNGKMRDTATRIADSKTSQWADASLRFEDTMARAAEGLNQSLTNLTVNLGSTQASLVRSITENLNGESDYIANTVRNATNAGTEISRMIWDAMQQDEKARAIQMVDGPNALQQNLNAGTQAIEANFATNMMGAIQNQAMLEQQGIDMRFAYSPAFASMAPYWGGVSDAFSQGFDRTMAYQQYGAQQQAMSQQNAMGWTGIGVGAATAFGAPALYGRGGGSTGMGPNYYPGTPYANPYG